LADEETGRPQAPEVVPEPGWKPIDPLRLEGGPRSFVSGEPAGDRLRVRYFRRERDGRLVGRAWFGPGAQGPPGHAHGGSMAAVLDEAMGAAAWMEGHLVVAVRLSTSFQRMLPLGTDALLEAWVERIEGRKVWTLGRLVDGDGEAFAEADALFVKLDPERFMPLIEKAAKALGVTVEELMREGPHPRPLSQSPSRTTGRGE
jgi:acyl-coenzyme A thioesterase PaaI-like protein